VTPYEARLVPAPVRLAQLLLVDGADLEQELELAAEMGAHHLRAVGRDRERDAVLGEGAEVSRTASSSGSTSVSRFEVGQSSNTIPVS
jgi:hypothetical protein